MADDKDLQQRTVDLLKGQDQSIVYIGNDKSYWGTIQTRVKRNEELKFRFVHLTFLTKQSPEQMFLKIVRENASIIYIDFSSDTEDMLKLSKYLHDEPITGSVPRVALIDERELFQMARAGGNDFIHFKDGEHHDVVYDPMEVSFPDKIKQPEFATAKFSMESRLIDDFSVIYYTAQGAHIEGNVRLAIGQATEFENAIPKSRIPSKKYFIKKTGAHDIVTDAKYFYDVDFTFADEPVFNNDELEKAKEIKSKAQRIQTIKLIKSDRQEQLDRYNEKIKSSKEAQKDWVEQFAVESSVSKTKILLIDMEMNVFKNDSLKLIDGRPFSLRCQSDFSESLKEIFTSRPAIIAFQMLSEEFLEKLIINTGNTGEDAEPRALTEGEVELKNMILDREQNEKRDMIGAIVRKIKEIPNYKPFFIVSNCCGHDSQTIQREYAYPYMMANKAKLDFKNILSMGEIYQKKAVQKEQEDLERKAEILMKTGKVKEVSVDDLREKRVYPDPDDHMAIMSYGVPITIKKMTESEIVFETEAELDYMQTFRLEHPLSMSLTIVKNSNGNIVEIVSGFNQYRALINTVDEIDKKYIRQYVNEIIFSPVKEERNREHSAFKELNEKFAKLKSDQLKEREESSEKK